MWGAMLMGGRAQQVAGTLTIARVMNGPFEKWRGYGVASAYPVGGALSIDLINGILIGAILDDYAISLPNDDAVVVLGGSGGPFASDPGIGYLTSVKVGSITRVGTDADVYTYASGVATWRWTLQPFGLAASGSTNYTVKTP